MLRGFLPNYFCNFARWGGGRTLSFLANSYMKHVLLSLAIAAGAATAFAQFPTTSYTLSGTTLTKWNGPETEIDLTTDPAFEGLTAIGDYAFQQKGVVSITLPNTVTSIGRGAFMDCVDLTSANVGTSLETLGNAAFSSCTALASIDLPEGFSSLGNSTFYNCTSLESISLPSSLTQIPYAAFSGSGLQTIDLGESVSEIGEEAFQGCSSLTSVSYSDALAIIGVSAFEETPALASFEFKSTLQEIATRAFAYSGLVSADLSALTSSCEFGTNIFFLSDALVSATLPAEEPWIGNGLFYGCTALEEITIPDSYVSVPVKLCQNCSGLKKVTLGSNVTTIGNTAFLGCSSLEEVVFNDALEVIDWSVFSYCSSLTEVTLPESLRSMDDWVFLDCSSLETVTLGSQVVSMGQECFEGCAALQTFTCAAPAPPTLGQWFFRNANTAEATLRVPDEAIGLYEGAEQWNEFGSIVGISSGIGALTENAAGCSGSLYDLSGRRVSSDAKGLLLDSSRPGRAVLKK